MDDPWDFLTSWTFLFILIAALLLFMAVVAAILVIVVRLTGRPQDRPMKGDETGRGRRP